MIYYFVPGVQHPVICFWQRRGHLLQEQRLLWPPSGNAEYKNENDSEKLHALFLAKVLERVQLERLSEVRMPMLEDGELKERLRQVYGRRKREDENEDVQKLLSTLMDGTII